MRTWLLKMWDALCCLLEHDAEGVIDDESLPPGLRLAIRNTTVYNLLLSQGILPAYRCRRCGELLQWQRSKGGWRAVSPEYLTHLIANARTLQTAVKLPEYLSR